MIDPHEFRNEEYDDGYSDAEAFERDGADQPGEEEEYDDRDDPNTNIGRIIRLMEFSQYGALAQIFVIDSVVKMAEKVANAPIESIGSNGFVSREAWQGVAREILKKLEVYR